MECVILIGLPASGKSTFYRERFAATHDLVSKDAMRHTRQPQRRQEQLIDASLGAGRSVVVDNTSPSVSARASIIAAARRHGARVAGYQTRVTPCAAIVRATGAPGFRTSPSLRRASGSRCRPTTRVSMISSS
jgi:predicted kinase